MNKIILNVLSLVFTLIIWGNFNYVSADVSCGWYCNGPGDYGCKQPSGSKSSDPGTCSDGSSGVCNHECVGSGGGTCYGNSVSGCSATKSSTGCCGGGGGGGNDPEGFLDGVNCTGLNLSAWGWAKDKDSSDKLTVEIYVNGQESSNRVGTSLANSFRQDLTDANLGDIAYFANDVTTLSSGTYKVFAKAKNAPGTGGGDKWLVCGSGNPQCKGGTEEGGVRRGGYLEVTCEAPNPAVVTGKVISKSSGSGIANVEVSTFTSKAVECSTKTDGSGNFTFNESAWSSCTSDKSSIIYEGDSYAVRVPGAFSVYPQNHQPPAFTTTKYKQFWGGESEVDPGQTSYEAMVWGNGDCHSRGGCNFEYSPAIPDCTGLSLHDADFNTLSDNKLLAGESYYALVTADPRTYSKLVDTVGVSVLDSSLNLVPNNYNPNVNDSNKQICTDKNIGYYTAKFSSPISTPNSKFVGPIKFNDGGTYSLYGRVWNDGITECKAACVDGPPRYLCPSAPGACKLEVQVEDFGAVTCGPDIISSPSGQVISPGQNTVLQIEANNFSNQKGVYSWSAQKGNINISGDSNCDPLLNICELDKGSKIVGGVTYTAPTGEVGINITDTVTFNLSAEGDSAVCNTEFKVCNPMVIESFFDKVAVNLTEGESTQLINTVRIADYNANKSYPTFTYDININCPAGLTCTFENGTSSKVVQFSSNQGNYINTFDSIINITSNSPTTGQITLYGSASDSTLCLNPVNLSTSVPVTVTGSFDLQVDFQQVEINGPDDVLTSNTDYCTDTSIHNNFNESLTIQTTKEDRVSGNFTTTYSAVTRGDTIDKLSYDYDYTFTVNLSNTLVNTFGLEVKCVQVGNVPFSGATASVDENDLISSTSNLRLLAVLGKALPKASFQAFGGSMFALLNVSSDLPVNVGKLLDSYNDINSGVLIVGGDIQNPSDKDRQSLRTLEIYPFPHKPKLTYLADNFSDSGSKTISDLKDISTSDTKTKFYYIKGDLTLSEKEYKFDNSTPVVFVDGDVVLDADVGRLDSYIVANGNILVGAKEDSFTVVNGGLVGEKITIQDQTNTQLLTGPTDKFYYTPGIFFADNNDISKFGLSETPIYVKTID